MWDATKSFTIRCWSLAHLALMVYDEDTFTKDDLLATASLPLACLRRGLRFVPLQNRQGRVIPTCGVFVEIDWQ